MAITRKLDRRVYLAFAVFIVVALIVTIAIVVPLSIRSDDEDDADSVKHVARMDCYPEAEGDPNKVNETECLQRNCDYDSKAKPACSSPSKSYSYSYERIKSDDSGHIGILTNSQDGSDSKWIFGVEYFDGNIMRFYMDSEKKDRYKVPVPLHLKKSDTNTSQYEFQVVTENPLAFHVTRKATGSKVWDLLVDQENGLVLSNQLLQIATRLPSTNVYGLGEHRHKSFKHQMNQTWPSFARDQPPAWTNNANLYGVHPFYTCVEDDKGNTHGVLLFNSNAQEYVLSDMPSLKFRTFGGILDLYIFMGPSPEQVIQQYTQAIGRPVMPPYWALGFQLCRFGYNYISHLKEAVDSTKHYGIPHDVQYVDIDHMQKQKIFTINEERFPKLNEYFHSLQEGGMKIMYLLDPCMIATEKNYEPYERIKAVKGEVKWQQGLDVPDNVTGPNRTLLGYAWPEGNVVFPDFFKNETQQVWESLIINYRSNLTFDGLWIDMNEPANHGTNLEKPWNWPKDKKPYWTLHCPKNEYEDPPIRPKAAFVYDDKERKARISDNTICMSTVQGNADEFLHYDVHSLYGWSHTVPTREAVKKATGKRSIVISRSTFPGSGTMAGHWLGENESSWPELHYSIIGMLEFNLFGIPYIGANICGFFGNVKPKLCKRWMQLGAFYPFSRNHNGRYSKKQGPGQLGDDVGIASREILTIRYQLLPYLYTLFHEAHVYGSTVVRPLHHVFPADKEALSIDRQFLWGSCLLISPILEENPEDLHFYLPKGVWYNYHTFNRTANTEGQWHSMEVKDDSLPQLHVRGGCIIVQQESANNTYYSQKNGLTLLIALDENNKAEGSFFRDDGQAIDAYENGDYFLATFRVDNALLTMEPQHKVEENPEWQNLIIERIIILPGNDSITSVRDDGKLEDLTFSKGTQNLTIELSSQIVNKLEISWR